ncbi:unnamed protein product [Clonostachys chloroleuca]|uniref:Uncharacterized protein n=1 Tax=Clonostachys chloroleuca TaxID=1926264 RepID=A0AA35M1U7_9HYPO|nr:unnamed protein product [Clonostachys chloroleuca]
MSLPTNWGIFLGDNEALSIRDLGDTYKPIGSQALIKVKYSAINPAYLKHFYVGLGGSITGYDWVGTLGNNCLGRYSCKLAATEYWFISELYDY